MKSELNRASGHIYTWLDKHGAPIRVAAPKYTTLLQRWVTAKIHNPEVFPTDVTTGAATAFASGGVNTPGAEVPIAMGPTTLDAPVSALAGRDWVGKKAGFPLGFFEDCRTIFRQIFRLYAHLYHSHWVEPFWHLSNGSSSGGWTDLNSCFVHFMSVAKLFGLLPQKDCEPMQPLIDIWIANGSIPDEAANGACAVTQPGAGQAQA